jgi:hypothetical protein
MQKPEDLAGLPRFLLSGSAKQTKLAVMQLTNGAHLAVDSEHLADIHISLMKIA